MFSLRGELRVGAAFVTGVVWFLAACSPGGEQSAEVDTAKGGDGPRAANAPGRGVGPMQEIQRVVKATGCPTTSNDPCQVTVSIEIVGRTYDMGPTNSPNGVRTVAIIKNLGDYPTERYAFKPSSQAYYFLKLKGALGRGRWEIDELMKDVGNTNSAFQSGRIRECVKEYPHDKTEIDFKPCPHPLQPAVAAHQMSLVGSAFQAASSIFRAAMQTDTTRVLESPLWITCNSGCCSL